MSSENVRQRRHIIQKLDFENCIITNLKTSSSGRKRLRARITREVEIISEVPEVKKEKESCEKLTSSLITRASSPVLLKKQCRKNNSPVFNKRKKSSEVELEKLVELQTVVETSSPNSPVFKTFKKQKTVNILSASNENSLEKSTNFNISNSQESSSSDAQSFFQIEDFTQESKQSVKISSVESPEGKAAVPAVYSVEPNSTFHFNSTPNYFKREEESESPKPVKRNYKKNSLLGRLHKLQQKQASEKLLWQHQYRENLSSSLTVLVKNFWKEEFSYILKCQSCSPSLETAFLIIDSRWVPNVKTVREGSVLRLQPPWQKLFIEGTMITVLLNVICLDVLDETKELILQKKSLEIVPNDLFNADDKLFINSLFSCCDSEVLY